MTPPAAMRVTDLPASPTDAAVALNRAAAAPNAPRLLVWVGNQPQSEALVHHAARLAAASGMVWTAIGAAAPPGGPGPGLDHTLRALRLAEQLGAISATVPTERVIDAVVERARRDRVSMVLIGGHAPDGWLDGLQRPWLGSLADALGVRLPGVAIDVLHLPDADADGAPRPAVARPEAPAEHWRAWSYALVVVALCTLVSEALLPYLELASVATLYLAGVVFVALRRGESAALVAVVASILAFDLLVVEPRWSLKPTDPQYYFTFLVMLVVGMLISRLVDTARRQTLVAQARARRAQALNELAGHLVSAHDAAEIGAGLAVAVRATFGAASALLLPDAHGRLVDAMGLCADRPGELDVAQQAFDEARNTEVPLTAERGEQLVCLLLPGARGALGVFAVRLDALRFGSPEDRRLLGAFANQAALAIERSRFQQRSAEASLEAERERLRSTVLSGISHDFRTPLTTIIGAATSLLEQRDALDETQRRSLQRSILDEARRLHGSMSDLLELTRLEEGAVQVECEWCPVDELVEGACLRLAARLQERRLITELPAGAVVWCDGRLVEQVLVNLLDNALRHTPSHCTIRIRVEIADATWRLIVADDGPGLPPGQEDEVFKKFFRFRGEPADAGTGLGLAICAAVARLHHGSIEARNAGGARLTLTLPQPEAPSLDEAA
jgi:two-component system, OmpR family, sensor histidine kinase KdpD